MCPNFGSFDLCIPVMFPMIRKNRTGGNNFARKGSFDDATSINMRQVVSSHKKQVKWGSIAAGVQLYGSNLRETCTG